VIIGFIGLGFLRGSGSWRHFSEPAVRTAPITLPQQFVISLLWVMVAYSGWNAATYVAEELKRPERTLPAFPRPRDTNPRDCVRAGEDTGFFVDQPVGVRV